MEKFSDISSGQAMVIHPDIPYLTRQEEGEIRDPASRLEEAVGLTAAIALEVVHSEVIRINRQHPSTLLGKGAIDRLSGLVKGLDVTVVIVDGTISPIQQRNLEKELNTKVIDRTGLILEIFGERARTHEGRLQVELASLTYQRSRLVRSWTHLERQRGGFGFMGGPGERQIEIDRRLIDQRVAKLKRELEDVKRTRTLHRKARKKVPYPIVALVGYTNAGKSTLFNRLSGAEVLAKDVLFATLDPTLRAIELPSAKKIMLSDTVGFISDLPTQLVAAFRATLEEVLEADLILHVRDISHPDSKIQKQDVLAVLDELGVEHSKLDKAIEVYNKCDLLTAGDRKDLEKHLQKKSRRVMISAFEGDNMDALTDLIDEALREDHQIVDLTIDLSDGETIAWLYEHGHILSREDDENQCHLTVELDPIQLARYRKRLQ